MSAWKSAEAVVGRNFLATLRGDDGTTASSPEKLQAAAGQASHRLLQGVRILICVNGGLKHVNTPDSYLRERCAKRTASVLSVA